MKHQISVITPQLHAKNPTPLEQLTQFIFENMQPYHDTPTDIRRGLDYSLCDNPDRGGFVLIAESGGELAGVLVVLRTGMGGYVPSNLLLFVCVDAQKRGQGLGRRLIAQATQMCDGDIKLHVEYDNPAKALYEQLGFESKYAEMRYKKAVSI